MAQEQRKADSLAEIYKQNTLTDTARLNMLRDLSYNELRDLDKGLRYAEELISLAGQKGDLSFLRIGYFLKGNKKRMLGQLDEALDAYIKSIEIAAKIKNLRGEGEASAAIADTYSEANDFPNALIYYRKAIAILRPLRNDSVIAPVILNTGDFFRRTKDYDSALFYSNEAKNLYQKTKQPGGIGYSLGNIGMVYASIGKNMLAEQYMNEAISILEKAQDYYPICVYLLAISDVYRDKGDTNMALIYALKSLRLAEQYGLKQQVADASLKLSEYYKAEGNFREAYQYFVNHISIRDSINNIVSVQRMYNLQTDYLNSKNQAELNILHQQKRNQKILLFFLGIILFLALIILFILLRNNKNKQKAYKVLNLQKQETDRERAKAEDALNELRLTQKQLIQSEKMASLGELTAGIAHELKNPLNFVNNFSEVSIELLDELNEGLLNKLPPEEKAESISIVNDLSENLKKIMHHGKRADFIVKGMLQHARPSTGKKEPININALADEYLRLIWNGLSEKDKAIIKNFRTDFDNSLSDNKDGGAQLEVIPQEIGKVLLNLLSNAFYAVIKKNAQVNEGYEPQITLATKNTGEHALIIIKDNGTGIPSNVIDKIFQPFFTTKPAGEGTGLGLSLSYDIIKAHGGELKVETKEGEYSQFTIQLPMNNHQQS